MEAIKLRNPSILASRARCRGRAAGVADMLANVVAESTGRRPPVGSIA